MNSIKMQNKINKARLLGCLQEVEVFEGIVYIISTSWYEHALYIPDNITQLTETEHSTLQNLRESLYKLRGNLKLVGGTNLTHLEFLFFKCDFDSVDFEELLCNKLVSLQGLFYKSKIHVLNLVGLNTSNVRDMSSMFYECNINRLDMCGIDTSNITTVQDMFRAAVIAYLYIPDFDISNIVNKKDMFTHCKSLIGTESDSIIQELQNYKFIKDESGYWLGAIPIK